MIIDIVKVFIPLTVSFVIGIVLIAPVLSYFLYKHKLWKKYSVSVALDGALTPIAASQHNDEIRKIPRMGGIVVWVSVTLTVFLMWILSELVPGEITSKLNFLSRNQTWVPLFTLLLGSLVGLVDDFLVTRGEGSLGGGLPLRLRVSFVALIGAVGGSWFYWKLGVATITIPFYGELFLGGFIVLLFVIVMLALFSGGIIDGIDGLSGGIMASIFAAYAGIAFYQQQIDIATFSAVIVGGLLAFLWFNIPPARFFMSETGMLGLTTALTVIAFLTDAVVFLPIIALPLFATSGSVIAQLLSKKYRGKKIFLSAPLHQHFQALGWPSYNVTMRYWIVGIICAVLGMILTILGKLLI
ncbi:MAG: hypothetical protein COV07_01940 [Candidatus Vogelbacteria bacterium CG10_big_fil_rev_8_21_14_0_10_45_14]|uniref:Phospho-N-acetylmuramoyl-pentapeptide-transferase n=1 Tax=Candidatus Vogelbacteria bacterium CG10_big_fil_rev_8_21_14_0_10_45_14 TaxID=1975042 RepID=A0A2H0RK06_9BACT|nr:MAG: hypothetical protein COV07_01940 [Candidatus Vogelbacteria bacterium CG10_big_fil_rev_8_21_14_0_10_45_14]